MKAISIKQPWAYLIAAGIKDIENRTWKCPEKYIGKRVLIHASAKDAYPFTVIPSSIFTKEQWNAIDDQDQYVVIRGRLQRSAIIGSVEIVDCVVNHQSIWAEKTNLPEQLSNECIWNWVLANPILFDEPILGVKGKLGFWDYEFDENTFECTNNNPYTHDSCGEKQGCIQHCDDCDYYKSKYE